MKDEEAQSCWDFWQCSASVRKKCPAYKTDSGTECWMVAGDYVKETKQCPRVRHGVNSCSNCLWFQVVDSD